MFANGQTVRVTPPATVDRTGDPVTGIAPFDVDNVSLVIIHSIEDLERRATTESLLIAEFPGGTVIPVGSHLTLPDGSRWRMFGVARTPHNPFTGWEPGVTIHAKAVV